MRILLLALSLLLSACASAPQRNPLAEWVPSPNFEARRPVIIVVHATEQGSARQSLETLRTANSKGPVSSHYLVGDDGRIYQLVADGDRAWHAGGGSWGTITDLNSASIGIEIDNQVGEPYTEAQVAALLRLLDADGRAYARFPITSGTAKFPLPIGDWTIRSINPDPWYNYDPRLIVSARRGDRKALLPPGPNGPVGSMWMGLSKPHYGIHGTPEPGLIGRTQSSGCVRLANWSAHAVAGAVYAGITVRMVE